MAKKQESKFKKGQEVTWTSQAAGSSKTKTGTIVAVVKAGANPKDAVAALPKKLQEKLTEGSFYGYGWGRDHDSYLVAVEGKTKTQLYWPLVSKLGDFFADVSPKARNVAARKAK